MTSILSCNTMRPSYQMTVKLYSDIVSTRVTDTKSIATVSDIAPTSRSKQKEKPTNGETANTYHLLGRVRRWVNNDINPNTIRTFSDHGEPRYADQTDAGLWLQQAFHDMRGVVGLLDGKDHHDYFIKTPQGKCAKASLVLLPRDKGNAKKVYLAGNLEVGIDTTELPIIYHMMFRPDKNRPPLEVPYCPNIAPDRGHPGYRKTVRELNKNDKKKDYHISKRGNDYVIKHITLPKGAPYKSKKLYIHSTQTSFVKRYAPCWPTICHSKA